MGNIKKIDREIREAYKGLSLEAKTSVIYMLVILAMTYGVANQMIQKGYESLFHIFTVGLLNYIANLMIGGVFVTAVFFVYYRVKKNKICKGGE